MAMKNNHLSRQTIDKIQMMHRQQSIDSMHNKLVAVKKKNHKIYLQIERKNVCKTIKKRKMHHTKILPPDLITIVQKNSINSRKKKRKYGKRKRMFN